MTAGVVRPTDGPAYTRRMLIASLAADHAPPQTGFSLVNLLILVVVVAIAFPLVKYVRGSARRTRRERWAREDEELRRQQTQRPEPRDPRDLP